jgi:hypothetical protein
MWSSLNPIAVISVPSLLPLWLIQKIESSDTVFVFEYTQTLGEFNT